MDRTQTIFSGQNVKVALRDADDQVLLRRLAVGFGTRNALVGLPQADDLVPAEQRLASGECPVSGLGLDVEVDELITEERGRVLERTLGVATRETHLWKQYAARLRGGLERGQSTCLGLVDQRVALNRLLVDFQKRRRTRHAGQNAKRSSDDQRFHTRKFLHCWRFRLA